MLFLQPNSFLGILFIGSYAFNWTWTGFKANDTVWDWLQLLLLPIALAAVPIWFTAEEGQQRIWLAQLKWIFFGKRSDLSGIVHRNLHFQLVLDRIQRSRYTLGLVRSADGAINCGCSANLV